MDKNDHKVIAILHGGYRYKIHCIQNTNTNTDLPSISPPTTIMPFSGLALAWTASNTPLPMTNGHPSPPALVGNLASQSVSTVTSHSTCNSVSILATTSSNSTSKLRHLFDVFNCLFHCYCHHFYNYIHNHPDNAGNYGSLSGIQASLQALVEILNQFAE
ncbi:hypothetical protein O181_128421 [Austropuccinia psidii MF-1]|uniref:Uncharacterized protein n=1 Tax=Austropuccinia psidii MF-1 TaxID=1389203 RepID=A0A9Q3KY22_9BASI|nr:hypothetical protein [Austropuccinia psidii MF-1]